VRGRMPTLELINERFARYLRIGLFNYMHRTTEISLGPIRVQKYSEFVRNLVVPTNLNLVHFKPLRGTGMIVLDPNLVFLVVDNMFGGDGRFHTRVEGRDFTPTEQRIIQGLLNVIFAEYEKAWKPVFELKLEYIRSEMNSQFANIATPSEIVVAYTISLEFSGSTAEMHLCLPYSMVEPIRDVLYSSMQSDHLVSDKRWIGTLTRQLQTAEVELVANLGTLADHAGADPQHEGRRRHPVQHRGDHQRRSRPCAGDGMPLRPAARPVRPEGGALHRARQDSRQTIGEQHG
jgi:flagellar motor switch protein FliM